MQKIYKTSYDGDKCVSSQEKVGTKTDFTSLSIEDLLIQHHKNKADTTQFYFKDTREIDNLLLIVTQDKEIIKELKMLSYSRPVETHDLFQTTNLNDFSKISIEKLLNTLEHNQSDYALDIDGFKYSFRLTKGLKTKNVLSQLNLYREELENISDYTESTTNKLKI
jgi:hypothetical protein